MVQVTENPMSCINSWWALLLVAWHTARDLYVGHQINDDENNQRMMPNTGAPEHLAEAIVEFMCGCVCCRATVKGDGEPSIVALQEAVTHAKQHDTVLANSPKWRLTVKWCSR